MRYGGLRGCPSQLDSAVQDRGGRDMRRGASRPPKKLDVEGGSGHGTRLGGFSAVPARWVGAGRSMIQICMRQLRQQTNPLSIFSTCHRSARQLRHAIPSSSTSPRPRLGGWMWWLSPELSSPPAAGRRQKEEKKKQKTRRRNCGWQPRTQQTCQVEARLFHLSPPSSTANDTQQAAQPSIHPI